MLHNYIPFNEAPIGKALLELNDHIKHIKAAHPNRSPENEWVIKNFEFIFSFLDLVRKIIDAGTPPGPGALVKLAKFLNKKAPPPAPNKNDLDPLSIKDDLPWDFQTELI